MSVRLQKLLISLKLNLRKLILILLLLSLMVLFAITLIVSNQIYQRQLINNSLATSYEYSAKVAAISDFYFKDLFSDLEISANIIQSNFQDKNAVKAELARLKMQSEVFNSVIWINADGRIAGYQPASLQLNTQIAPQTLGINDSLKFKKPYISSPYTSVKGNLVILMSYPIFDQNKQYLGFIGGIIYLHDNNLLKLLLSEGYGYKNSYLYVINEDNKIIYHPEKQRIGTTVHKNTGLPYLNTHASGRITLTNDKGIDHLAGFSKIPTTHWTVVFQQPTAELLAQARALTYQVLGTIFIIYIIMFLLIWGVSRFITAPLNDLAKMASHLNDPGTVKRIHAIQPWYFEVLKFKKSLLSSVKNFTQEIKELKQDSLTDPLTNFYNRRGLEMFLNEFIAKETPFAVVILDIDYFKKINDTHGHDMGDLVLTKVAAFIRESFREQDICCRVGGEEFMILAPVKEIAQAVKIAERLRHKLASTYLLEVGIVTASFGIAHWPLTSEKIKEVLKQADTYLYQAKNMGRNQIVV